MFNILAGTALLSVAGYILYYVIDDVLASVGW